MDRLIALGAEAKISRLENTVKKDRISKSYRHSELDAKIRKGRTKSEAKLIVRAFEAGVNVPKIISSEEFILNLEYLDGDKLSERLNSYPLDKQTTVMEKLGEQVALLHSKNIIHGDLTTSNVILREEKIYLIDFGLGFISTKIEDKAVDLHLLKQALEAKHFLNPEELFLAFLKGYKFEDSNKVLERLEVVEKRGRYKH